MMKKYAILICLVIFTSALTYSQGARYGFRAGLNFSSISNFEFDVVNVDGGELGPVPSSVEDGRTAFTAGFLVEFPLSERISLQPEFVFSRNGNDNVGLKYDYLQLPIALKVNINKFFVNLGPQPGIKVSFFEQSEFYKSIDFSAFGGIGYFFGENFFAEIRYTRGFAEIFEDGVEIALPTRVEGTNENDLSTRLTNLSGNNAYFTFSVGYRL